MAEPEKGATPDQCAALVSSLPVGGFGLLTKHWKYRAPNVVGQELLDDMPPTEMTIRRVSFATFTVEFGGPMPEVAVQAIVRALAGMRDT